MRTRITRSACLVMLSIMTMATLAVAPSNAAPAPSAVSTTADVADVTTVSTSDAQPLDASGCMDFLVANGYVVTKKRANICSATQISAILFSPMKAFGACTGWMMATRVDGVTATGACSHAAFG